MQLESSAEMYGVVARSIHWASAASITALLVTGFVMASSVAELEKPLLFLVHAALGVLTLLLTLGRLAWWIFVDNKPTSSEVAPYWQTQLARLVHTLIYALIFVLIISGIRMTILWDLFSAATSNGAILFPEIKIRPPRIVHGLAGGMLTGLIALHVGAALFHHYGLRDGMLKRMGIG